MVYKVKLDIFEGPFDLLVYLIENAQMNIYDIEVAKITKQYIDYVEQIKQIDATLVGEFMVLAATLIEIKSKMLLPRKTIDNEAGFDEDPRDELVRRLLEYKAFKSAAAYLEKQETLTLQIHSKPKEDISIYTMEPDIYLHLELTSFIKAFHGFLYRKKKIEEVNRRYNIVKQRQITVEERIEQIRGLFSQSQRLNFKELLDGELTRHNIVITFLAMLELIKQKTIKFNQNVNFGEIQFTIDKKGIGLGERR